MGKEVREMIIGDFTGVLYTVLAILGALLTGYAAALLVSFRSSRPGAAAKSTQPKLTHDRLKAA
jgi:hypothetical protein